MELYTKDWCGYSAKVIHAAELLGVPLTLKNIADPEVEKELIRRGGKRQVPYLEDAEKGVGMYESEDIIVYLQERAKEII